MSAAPSPASPAEALAMLRSAMGYLAAADATALATETQAQCLLALEQLDAIETAARASMLAAFTAGQGYAADADYSPRAWLMYKTRVTKGAASGHLGWVGRAAAHPQVIAALAEGHILSESVARRICQWTDKLPGDCRLAADAILIVAAKSGADLRGLAELAAEIYARSLPDDPDDGPDDGFDDRSVRLETTFDGAGVLAGDLTPQCAAVVTAVLDALSAPAGAGDTRTYGQRYHDALQEAMRRLVASDLLPGRAGQPVKVVAHIALADLMLMEGSSALQEEWIASARAAWAAALAGASVGGSDGAAWLDSAAAQAVACDASVTPVVTGDVNPAALDDLVRLCVELDRPRNVSLCTSRAPPSAGVRVKECSPPMMPGRPALQRSSAFGSTARILGLMVIVRPFGWTVLRVSREPTAICPEASGNSGFQRGYAARSVSAAQTFSGGASIWIVADTVFIAGRPGRVARRVLLVDQCADLVEGRGP